MKIAVVTGATSGMGMEFVKEIDRYYKQLDEIWVIGRRTKRMEGLQRKVSKPLRILSLDLLQSADLDKYHQLITKKQPKVVMLVNSAGFGKVGDYSEISLKEQLDMIDLNCKSLVEMTLMTLPYMVKGGHIIQMASAAAFLPQKNFAVYSASKSFVLSYSRALNEELRNRPVTVTAVCPGPVKTEFFQIAEQTGHVYFLKKFFMADKRHVVRKALQDAHKNRDISVYGFWMNGFRLLTKVLPHRLILICMRLLK